MTVIAKHYKNDRYSSNSKNNGHFGQRSFWSFNTLPILYCDFFITHEIIQGPSISRPKDRVFFDLKTVYIQFF